MSRVFLSHSSRNSAEAVALKRWLVEQDPGLADEIFLDLDRDTGIAPGERWKRALRQANERCEVVLCLLSAHWQNSSESLAADASGLGDFSYSYLRFDISKVPAGAVMVNATETLMLRRSRLRSSWPR